VPATLCQGKLALWRSAPTAPLDSVSARGGALVREAG